jgi:hypothetical protein
MPDNVLIEEVRERVHVAAGEGSVWIDRKVLTFA